MLTPCRRRLPDGVAVGSAGSALVLFPAAALIMVVLAAMAVDSSVAFLARRELTGATAAAANDASTVALSPDAFYRAGRLEIDASTLSELAARRVAMVLDPNRHRALQVSAVAVPPAEPGCGWTVQVSASSSVSYVFARALPQADEGVRVTATSTARPAMPGREC